MKRRRGVIITALTVLLSLTTTMVASVALADPSAEDHDRARGLLADGRAKRAANDHAAALESFKAAHAIENLSTTGYEVGRTLVALGRLIEARELLRDVGKSPAGVNEPPPLASARADARALVDELERRIPTLIVKLKGTVDASVTATVDGVPVAIDLLDQPRRLDPGEHVVIIRKGKGKGESKFTVPVAESERREVMLDVPVDPDAPTGPVMTPANDPKPRTAGDEDGRSAAPKRSYTIAWVAGAVAVVGIGVGSVTGAIAASEKSELEVSCPGASCPPNEHDNLSAAHNVALASTIAFSVAAASVVVLVWDLVSKPSALPPTPSRVTAGVGAVRITF